MRQHAIRSFDENRVFETLEGHQLCIRHGFCYLRVEARIAATVQFARKDHGLRRNLIDQDPISVSA